MALKEEVDKITTPLLTFGGEEYRGTVEGLVLDLLGSLEEVVATLRRALLFMLMKVSDCERDRELLGQSSLLSQSSLLAV